MIASLALATSMVGLLRLYFKLLFLSVGKSRWVRWLLGISFIVVLVGLMPVLLRDSDPLFPFGISVLDLVFIAALCIMLFGFAVVLVSVIGIPLFRYGGILAMVLGVGLLGYQAYAFVRLGAWPPFSLRTFTDALFLTWGLDEPTGWIKVKAVLASVLERTPLSLFLIAAGGVWTICASKILANALQDLQDYERELSDPFGKVRGPPKPFASPRRRIRLWWTPKPTKKNNQSKLR